MSAFDSDAFERLLLGGIHSVAGPNPIEHAVASVSQHWADLRQRWDTRTSPNGYRHLGIGLREAAKLADDPRLRCNTIKLRNEFATRANSGFDIAVVAKVMRSIIDLLADGNEEARHVAAAIAEEKDVPTAFDHTFIANIIVGDANTEIGNFEVAAAALRKNLVASTCPTTQHFLYRCLAAMRDKGLAVNDPHIYTDDLSKRFCSAPFDTLSTGTDGRKHGATVMNDRDDS